MTPREIVDAISVLNQTYIQFQDSGNFDQARDVAAKILTLMNKL